MNSPNPSTPTLVATVSPPATPPAPPTSTPPPTPSPPPLTPPRFPEEDAEVEEWRVFGYNAATGSWHCTQCGENMGPGNPRQLCRKSYCDGV